MSVKIQDVARMAGVSIGTVSRVFNNYTDISPETKKRVLEVANELNYVPNVAARTLSSKNKKKVAMIFNEFQMDQKNAIPLEVLSGVHDAANEVGIEFILLLISEKEQREKPFRTLCTENNITGVVMQGLDIEAPYYKEIQSVDIPTVLIDLSFESENSYSVSIDNYQASYDVVNYLHNAGHRHIGMLAGKKTAMVSNIREEGYRQALKDLNLDFTEKMIGYGEFDEQKAYEMTENYIAQNPDITAIFCASDLMAIGMMRRLKELGYKLPKDISMVGFDDLFVSNYVSPTLSSVHQDMYKIGKEACYVVNKLMNNEYVPNKQIFVPYYLNFKNSVIERKPT